MTHDPSVVRDRQALYQYRYGLDRHTALHAARLMLAVPGLVITSGLRSVRRNADVGGAPNSFHLRGRAIDVVAPLDTLNRALYVARTQRVSPNCTGPEEAFIEAPGTRRMHLHCAW